VVPTYKRDEHVRHEADLYLDGFLAGRLLESKGLALSWASLLKDEANQIFLSAVTAWEIATKVRTGKLDFESAHLADFDGMARAMSFEPLAITARHVVAGARLPGEHTDPFDRLLAGQAETGGLRLVSADPAFEVLGIPALWA
jgi:PIN domain nuclease of toxin-antitoxin system